MSEERDLGKDKCQHKCQHQQDLLQWELRVEVLWAVTENTAQALWGLQWSGHPGEFCPGVSEVKCHILVCAQGRSAFITS